MIERGASNSLERCLQGLAEPFRGRFDRVLLVAVDCCPRGSHFRFGLRPCEFAIPRGFGPPRISTSRVDSDSNVRNQNSHRSMKLFVMLFMDVLNDARRTAASSLFTAPYIIRPSGVKKRSIRPASRSELIGALMVVG